MTSFSAIFGFSVAITVPIFAVMLIGVWLKHIQVITEDFIQVASKLVFNVTLPILLFIKTAQTPLSESGNIALIVYGSCATVFVWLLLEVITRYTVQPPPDRCVIVQGAFRSNMGIIGLAYVANAYGDAGIAAASLYVGLVTIVYNIVSVITLSYGLEGDKTPWQVMKQITRNPLIIGITAALPFAWFEIQIPQLALQVGEYFAQITLPLALLCTGGSLSLIALRNDFGKTLFASIAKLAIIPLLVTAGGAYYGFRDMELGILFLMCSAPTASASYIMVKAMGGNDTLAANIIALTTLASVVSSSVGIMLLKYGGWL